MPISLIWIVLCNFQNAHFCLNSIWSKHICGFYTKAKQNNKVHVFFRVMRLQKICIKSWRIGREQNIRLNLGYKIIDHKHVLVVTRDSERGNQGGFPISLILIVLCNLQSAYFCSNSTWSKHICVWGLTKQQSARLFRVMRLQKICIKS